MAVKTYTGEDLDVTFDTEACVHSGECVRRLAEVFDTRRRPWVLPDAAAAQLVIDTILHCPSGALRYAPKKGQPVEEPDVPTTMRAKRDGPLYARGDLAVLLPDGSVVKGTRFALCRCGASQRKPFCDMTHRKIGFRDAPQKEDEPSPDPPSQADRVG